MGSPFPQLYWCWTEDGEEDWFVTANSAMTAIRHFEELHSYERGEVFAAPVGELQAGLSHWTGLPRSAELATLQRCGATVLRAQRPRVVRIGADLFVEGIGEAERRRCLDDVLEARGRGRPNGTQPKAPS